MAYETISVNWFRQFTTVKQTATRHNEKAHFPAGAEPGATLV